MTGRTFTVQLPAGLPLLNANRRVRHERTKAIREAACLLARGKVPPLARAHVIGEYRPPDRRRRDVANLYPSFKAVIVGGGCEEGAGVLPDDSDRYLIGAGRKAVTR